MAYLVTPSVFNTALSAPTLVHTSSRRTSSPAARIRLCTASLDSLLVLLQKRKGMWAARSVASAWAAPGVGDEPIRRVPEMSMRSARIGGGLDLSLEVIWTRGNCSIKFIDGATARHEGGPESCGVVEESRLPFSELLPIKAADGGTSGLTSPSHHLKCCGG